MSGTAGVLRLSPWVYRDKTKKVISILTPGASGDWQTGLCSNPLASMTRRNLWSFYPRSKAVFVITVRATNWR